MSKAQRLVSFLFVLAVVTALIPGKTIAARSIIHARVHNGNIIKYFKVTGNRVIAPDGSTYIPEGISIYGGLEDTDYLENTANIDAQIKAAALYWHSNTIRLQVAESNLFLNPTKSSGYNQVFLRELIREVSLARQLNLVVVINDQTEFTNNTPLPTAMTLKFWRVMSSVFGNNPYVIFDLFNEPRLENFQAVNRPGYNNRLARILFNKRIINRFMPAHKPVNKLNLKKIWTTWKYGGIVNKTRYIGMQTLVNKLRSSGNRNLIWVEGPFWGQSLPSGKYLLTGSNLVYSYHHINLNHARDWQFIGTLAANHAVVDGEWAQYQAPWQECYAKAPSSTPQYLNYLHNHGVGLIAWSLQAGSLLKGNPNVIPNNNNSPNDPKTANQLSSPSRFDPNYRCNTDFGHGAGALLKNYFLINSHPV